MIKIIEPIGPCINSQCPRRHICRNEKCYPNSLKAESNAKCILKTSLNKITCGK